MNSIHKTCLLSVQLFGTSLCRAQRSAPEDSAWNGFRISVIAAILKSLSPAGKRLTPMLAITTQGFLFSVGTLIGGKTFFGCALGMVLLSLWAFLQPALIYLLVFGRGIVDVGQYFFEHLQQVIPVTYEHLLAALLLVVVTKCALGIAVAYLAVFKPHIEKSGFYERLAAGPVFQNKPRQYTPAEKAKLLFKDLTQPWFVISLGMMSVFFSLTQPMGIALVWYLLRPIAAGLIVFYAIRFLPIDKWLTKNSESSEHVTLKILANAIQRIKTMQPSGRVQVR